MEAMAKMFEKLSARIACRRVGQPGYVADCIVYLCSEEASYINVVETTVDGGVRISGANCGYS